MDTIYDDDNVCMISRFYTRACFIWPQLPGSHLVKQVQMYAAIMIATCYLWICEPSMIGVFGNSVRIEVSGISEFTEGKSTI